MGVALTFIAALARIVWLMIRISPTTQVDPRHLDLAYVLVAIAWIEVQHASDYRKQWNRPQFMIGLRWVVPVRVRWSNGRSRAKSICAQRRQICLRGSATFNWNGFEAGMTFKQQGDQSACGHRP